jgi:S-adenosylmethionine synthetase
MKRRSSESVLHGHPDKVADAISDAILDAHLKEDKHSRVGCETLLKGNTVIIAGEITSTATINPDPIIRNLLRDTGYRDASWGIDPDTCTIHSHLTEQSPEIADSIAHNSHLAAGDQAIVYGYATDETDTYLPLAHHIAKKLTDALSTQPFPYLRPDGKALCTINGDKIDTLAVSLQYDGTITIEAFKSAITDYLHKTLSHYLTQNSTLYINGFLFGGPLADTGITGRKIIVDTYGPPGPHGGGAFSGKDPTKIDRSGALAARYIAKNIVATSPATKATVKITYIIGKTEPIDLQIVTDTSTDYVPYARENFPLTPSAIIDTFDLQRPIYQDLAQNGHFGRDLPWEQIL